MKTFNMTGLFVFCQIILSHLQRAVVQSTDGMEFNERVKSAFTVESLMLCGRMWSCGRVVL